MRLMTWICSRCLLEAMVLKLRRRLGFPFRWDHFVSQFSPDLDLGIGRRFTNTSPSLRQPSLYRLTVRSYEVLEADINKTFLAAAK